MIEDEKRSQPDKIYYIQHHAATHADIAKLLRQRLSKEIHGPADSSIGSISFAPAFYQQEEREGISPENAANIRHLLSEMTAGYFFSVSAANIPLEMAQHMLSTIAQKQDPIEAFLRELEWEGDNDADIEVADSQFIAGFQLGAALNLLAKKRVVTFEKLPYYDEEYLEKWEGYKTLWYPNYSAEDVYNFLGGLNRVLDTVIEGRKPQNYRPLFTFAHLCAAASTMTIHH